MITELISARYTVKKMVTDRRTDQWTTLGQLNNSQALRLLGLTDWPYVLFGWP